MNESANNITCAEFQALLPELLDSSEETAKHPHLRNCDNCRALLTNLESIAEAVRLLFPVVEPPDALWGQIEIAIRRDEGNSTGMS